MDKLQGLGAAAQDEGIPGRPPPPLTAPNRPQPPKTAPTTLTVHQPPQLPPTATDRQVDKLQDLRAAAQEEGFEISIPDSLNTLEKVGQFQQLVELAEMQSDLKNKVGGVEGVGKEEGVEEEVRWRCRVACRTRCVSTLTCPATSRPRWAVWRG